MKNLRTKIFGVGLPKTGITSLHIALSRLGFRSIHFPISLAEIEANDAAVNLSISSNFEALDRGYPGSKFILTVRDLQDWLTSCAPQYSANPKYNGGSEALPDQSAYIEFFLKMRMKSFGAEYFDAQLFEKAYALHNQKVRNYFADRPDDFLIMNLAAGDGWQVLCDFLKSQEPQEPFIHANHHQELVPSLNADIVARLMATDSSDWIR